MNPRKKSKPNPKADATADADASADADANTPTPSSSTPDGSQTLPNTPAAQSILQHSNTSSGCVPDPHASEHTINRKASRKWLGGGGSWRSKASATVKTAKDSIGVSVSGGAASQLPSEDVDENKSQSPAKFLTKRKSSKGDALPASMTKLNVSSDGAIDQTEEQKAKDTPPTEQSTPRVDEPPLPPEPMKKAETHDAGTWGWRSWWSRPDGYAETSKRDKDAQTTPLPGVTPSEEAEAASKELGNDTSSTAPPESKDVDMKDASIEQSPQRDTDIQDAPQNTAEEAAKNTSTSSWFWLWSSTQNTQPNPESAPAPAPTSITTNDEPSPKGDGLSESIREVQPPQQQEPVTEPPPQPTDKVAETDQTTKSSGWAFWFKDKPKVETKGTEESSQKHVGEVAVSDTPSQSNPEPAQFNEQGEPPKDAPKENPPPVAEESLTKRSFRSLRGRPRAKTTKETPTITPSSSNTGTPSKTSPTHSPTRPETAPAPQSAPKSASKAKQEPPNLVLPEFSNTYRMVQQPSFWKQLRQYFLGGEPVMPHLHINPAPPRIKKAVAIGVHGFFPAAIFQKVIGQPKGTSIRFSNAAAAAIKEWCELRGYEPEIEQIALEGEGFIADRVKTLWKLLLNWIEHIKQADFILVACHSQGVPVAIMLVAKLIQFGCVNATRIGICAMAGVNMGPFVEYKTKYFGPTAAELFEFGNPKSLVSQMYLAALDEILRFGVRILYVGSIDDQLVSLESSTFSTLSHPYIYRAVFVDGRIHAPDFVTHLVGFTLKMRNLGLPDHGLIRELSPALAGSLYGGEGHSRVYEDPSVYILAVQHALETTSLPVTPAQSRQNVAASFAGINIPVPGAKADPSNLYKLRVKDYSEGGAGVNPFFLPWAMRGLLEEDFVKKELGKEVEDLLNMFEDWKPTGKQLKDVKFRLEGVRSKL
ncbi:hypothetical protein DM02DRAFT_611360 [Periconia macrospinosa]|uniref:YMC020W-like alpha/beta hydrolase domain-containing protein n=1 Tax=Periconia macrospinosa TaxID=97972 RepID=A0A2V1E358_9PLEO|nr:hypothetical protein DM02DRAFT_611360 [Periconia macrospinosa]